MTAAHFALRPVLALQLASRVDAYATAVRCLVHDRRAGASPGAEAQSLLALMELARPVPSLWTAWGAFVVAIAEFRLRLSERREAPELALFLKQVDVSADALIRQALQWALFEQHQFPVSLEVAQAFIDWDAARKVAFELRQSAGGQASGARPSAAPEVHEWQSTWEEKSAELLLRAVSLLEQGGAARQ